MEEHLSSAEAGRARSWPSGTKRRARRSSSETMAFVFFVGLMAGVCRGTLALLRSLLSPACPLRDCGPGQGGADGHAPAHRCGLFGCASSYAGELAAATSLGLDSADPRDNGQRKNHRHTGTKRELAKRLLDLGVGGTDAQAELAERLSRRRGLGHQQPGPEDLATLEDLSRWLTVAQEKR